MNDKNLHIVHIIPWLGFGGAERSVVDLVNHSNPLIRYTIILFFDHKPFAALITSSNVQIKVVQKRGKLSLGLLFALKKLLKQLQPDVVHTHLFGGDVWGRLAAKNNRAAWSGGCPGHAQEKYCGSPGPWNHN
jgi:hypothetical protein